MRRESPILKQRKIRAELKRLRERRGLTQHQVARDMYWSDSKVIRIERGSVRISPGDLNLLLNYYGVSDQQHVQELMDLARGSWAEEPFWAGHRQLFHPQFVDFMAYELDSSAMLLWNLTVIPGVLQTEAYMRALFTKVLRFASDEVDARVDVRIGRQQRLHSDDPPRLDVILDESVVNRWIGGPEVTKGQLEHLLEMNSRPNVDIRIVRFEAGAHPGLHQTFVLLEFSEDHEGIVYLESSADQRTIREDPETAEEYRLRFCELQELASEPTELEDILNPILAKL